MKSTHCICFIRKFEVFLSSVSKYQIQFKYFFCFYFIFSFKFSVWCISVTNRIIIHDHKWIYFQMFKLRFSKIYKTNTTNMIWCIYNRIITILQLNWIRSSANKRSSIRLYILCNIRAWIAVFLKNAMYIGNVYR